MALQTDALGEIQYRSANLPSYAGPWTICLWYYQVAGTPYGNIILPVGSATPPNFAGTAIGIAFNSAGTGPTIWHNNAPAGTAAATATGVWLAIWVQRGAAAGRTDLYTTRTNSIAAQGTATLSATAAGGIGIGGIAGSDPPNSRTAAVKWWSALLTFAEMYIESCFYVPIRSTNLEGCYPLVHSVAASNVTDFSGLARPLTTAGAPGVIDGPPILWAPPRQRVLKAALVAPAGALPHHALLLGVGR